MATQTQFVPLDVYLHSSYEPDAEYVDGVIEERPTGEFDHASWQDAILAWFRSHAQEWNVRSRPELRIQTSATRFRVPDVTVLDRAQPVEQIIPRAPIAVFEILSAEDTVQRLMRKLNDYAAMGIAEIWVVDPETKSFSRFEEGQLLRRTVFEHAGKGIRFEVREIEQFLD